VADTTSRTISVLYSMMNGSELSACSLSAFSQRHYLASSKTTSQEMMTRWSTGS
jgi:hypothetical protein